MQKLGEGFSQARHPRTVCPFREYFLKAADHKKNTTELFDEETKMFELEEKNQNDAFNAESIGRSFRFILSEMSSLGRKLFLVCRRQ